MGVADPGRVAILVVKFRDGSSEEIHSARSWTASNGFVIIESLDGHLEYPIENVVRVDWKGDLPAW